MVHKVRISSNDFAASLDAADGAGPVVDAPRAGVLVAPEFAAKFCPALVDSVGLAPKRLGLGSDEVEAGASGFLPRVDPKRLGVEAAGAEDLSVDSSFFPKPPNKPVDGAGVVEAAGADVLLVSSFFWPILKRLAPPLAGVVAAGLEASLLPKLANKEDVCVPPVDAGVCALSEAVADWPREKVGLFACVLSTGFDAFTSPKSGLLVVEAGSLKPDVDCSFGVSVAEAPPNRF